MATLPCYFFILAFVASRFGPTGSTKASQCETYAVPLPEVVVENCEEQPCIFYINKNATMTMKFRAPRYLENIRPNALAHALGIDLDYPLGQSDACEGITNTPCPIAENEYVEYTFSMFIYSVFPEISFSAEFSLVDVDNGSEPFVCFEISVQLVRSDASVVQNIP